MAPDDLLTADEVAELLRRPLNTIRFWRYNGDGPPSFRIGRRVMYRRGDLDAWIRQQRDAATRSGA